MPNPGPGQLLIHVHRCGICGTDLHMTDIHSCFNPTSGSVLGHEFAGEIVQCGPDNEDRWREGMRIAALPYIGCGYCVFCLSGRPTRCASGVSQASGGAMGGYCEYTVVSAMNSVKLDEGMSWEEGAFIEPIAVGLHAVARSGMRTGARVLILGAGPVGLAAAAAAKVAGAAFVGVAARTDRRANLSVEMGADEFFQSDDELADRFRIAAGDTPDIVIECTGAPGMTALTSGLAGYGGTIVMAGACMQPDTYLPIAPTVKEVNIAFAVYYSRQEFELAANLIAKGAIKPMPMFDGVVEIDDLPAKFEELRRDKSACKIMVRP
nr:alcohol dehydrogenase catalytic domain-containing protein [Croceicoccus ponticola]